LSDTSKVSPRGLYIEPMKKRHQHGFTLYELLTTIMIVGVVIAIGVPNMAEFTQNSRLTGTSNDMLSSFHIARSEAARSKSNITICASANSLDPAAACGGTFNDGWIVFVDLNGDLIHDAPAETIVRAFPPVATGVVVTVNANANYFAFAGTGLGRGDVGGNPALSTVMICDSRGIDVAPGGRATARRMVATPIGRATIISDKTMILNAGGVCP
jgi:type IV fimbrial biogenesis protein FimT